MNEYLDTSGLNKFSQALNEKYTEKQEGMGLSHNDFTDEYLQALTEMTSNWGEITGCAQELEGLVWGTLS